MGDAALRMDRMYRHQRHIYDLTRRFYLLGRERLIRDLTFRPGEIVCEIGCGTARNLILLADRHPDIHLLGVDASAEMLRTATAAVRRAGHGHRIRLAQGLAETVDPGALFGLDRPVDRFVFSYSLSMIEDWRAAVEHALALLAPGGAIEVVDFGDLARFPGWFRTILLGWLRLFDVHPRTELAAHLHALVAGHGGSLDARSIQRGYSMRMTLCRSPAAVAGAESRAASVRG